jgi:hypothetical protein
MGRLKKGHNAKARRNVEGELTDEKEVSLLRDKYNNRNASHSNANSSTEKGSQNGYLKNNPVTFQNFLAPNL